MSIEVFADQMIEGQEYEGLEKAIVATVCNFAVSARVVNHITGNEITIIQCKEDKK